eukprot:jgi/Phyca11/130060/e_gw1.90.27.1
MAHLGRSPGNPLPVICQKSITGHPKGAAAAWQLNGLLQVLNTGLIPGNRQLDNTWETLRKFNHLVYPNRSLQTGGVKAVLLKSFGFGQASGELLIVHPDYLLSTLCGDDLKEYVVRRDKRLIKMNSHAQSVITSKRPHIHVKNEAPYSAAQESSVYLDPTARAEYDPTADTWRFGVSARQNPGAHTAGSSSGLLTVMNQAASELGLASAVGVSVQPVDKFESLHGCEDLIQRNFTNQEMAYCYSAAHPAASFAGRWAAKEAVVKAMTNATPKLWDGAGLREIEIVMATSGAPAVVLSGYAQQFFSECGFTRINVSISHSDHVAVAQAVAGF